MVKSIFSVGGVNYSVLGSGQDAVSSMLNKFPNKKIFFLGFLINDRFISLDSMIDTELV